MEMVTFSFATGGPGINVTIALVIVVAVVEAILYGLKTTPARVVVDIVLLNV